MDEDAAVAGDMGGGDGVPIVDGAIVRDDAPATPQGALPLDRRRIGRHDNGGGDAEKTGRFGYPLRVVAGRHGDDAPRPLGRSQRRDSVVGAAELERTGALEVLGLEENPRPCPLIEKMTGEERRAHRVAGDAPGGMVHVVDGRGRAHGRRA